MRAYIHISDTHFGSKGVDDVVPRLKMLLGAQLETFEPGTKVNFIVTGDGVDSPTKANNKQYLEFSHYLQELTDREPIFVLGNHDVNSRGLAFWRGNQILASYVGRYPQLKRARDLNLIFLLFNSNTKGFLAQGEIGAEQMQAAAALLAQTRDRDHCTVIAVLHHHVAPVPGAQTPDPPFWKRFIPKALSPLFPETFFDETRKLTDAKAFVQFLKEQQIRFVLHGHKHIPFMTEHEGLNIIACGSSTRRSASSGRQCVSYNVLTFDENSFKCDQYAEYDPGAGAELIASQTFGLQG